MRVTIVIVAAAACFFPRLALAQDAAPAALESRVQELEARLNKLEGAPASASISSFNPAMGLALDTVLRSHNDKTTFDFRAAELNLEAAADPFVKVWAVITGSNGGIDVEEAAAQTTSLPYNMTARGGRVFAPFGRLPAWHDHELPMVYRPNSILAYVGAETHADGLDLNYLLPVPFYMEATAGAYNAIGAANNRVDNAVGRALDQFTYLGRLHAYNELTDSAGLDIGVSAAWTPKRSAASPATGAGMPLNRSWRTLSGVDLTFRYQPSAGGLYKGVLWTTEVLQDQENLWDPVTGLPQGRTQSYAGYSNVETKLGRVVRMGGFADLTQLPNDRRKTVKTFAGYITLEITEFNRVRLQFARVVDNFRDAVTAIPGTSLGPNDLFPMRAGHMVALQWTCVIGYHVHGFRGRWGT